MEFRYFRLVGDSLEKFLQEEAIEFNQRREQTKALLEDRDDIEKFRPDHNGGVLSLVFKPGCQPDFMVRASKGLPENEVRPHRFLKAAQEFRCFLDGIKVRNNCTGFIRDWLSLPVFVLGLTPKGMASYNSRVGHVGDDVIVEVPDPEGEFEGHEDLKEIKAWEFMKLCEENKNYEYDRCYTMNPR